MTTTVEYTAPCPCCDQDTTWTTTRIHTGFMSDRTTVTVTCPTQDAQEPAA